MIKLQNLEIKRPSIEWELYMYKDRTPQWLHGNNSNELKNLFYEEEMARGKETCNHSRFKKKKTNYKHSQYTNQKLTNSI